MSGPQQVPSATLAVTSPRARARRGLQAVLAAPRWATGIYAWAFSGVYAIGLGDLLDMSIRRHDLSELKMAPSITLMLGIAGLALLFSIPAVIYTLSMVGSKRLRGSRAGSALVTAAVTGGLHAGLWYAFGGWPLWGIEIPLAVGLLWGSWLPEVAKRWFEETGSELA